MFGLFLVERKKIKISSSSSSSSICYTHISGCECCCWWFHVSFTSLTNHFLNILTKHLHYRYNFLVWCIEKNRWKVLVVHVYSLPILDLRGHSPSHKVTINQKRSVKRFTIFNIQLYLSVCHVSVSPMMMMMMMASITTQIWWIHLSLIRNVVFGVK